MTDVPKLRPLSHAILKSLARLQVEQAEKRGGRQYEPIRAGAIAHDLGYHRGPRQFGNGAKSKRSFTGYGAVGKWVGPALTHLRNRGLVYDVEGYSFLGYRWWGWRLTDEGVDVAIALPDIDYELPEKYREQRGPW